MNIGVIVLSVVISVTLLVVGLIVYSRLPKKLKTDKYALKWKEIQGYCRDKAQWPTALEEADKMLDAALRRRKYKGKSMGERMVSAQRVITNNDAMWFAHNLHKKAAADPKLRLKEADVKAALIGFRQALKDVGAIKTQTKDGEQS
jgi:hypothetical protein